MHSNPQEENTRRVLDHRFFWPSKISTLQLGNNTQPLCVVIGDKPGAFASQRLSMELYGRAASKDKQLVVVEGASYYDLYDQPGPTGEALENLVPFFGKHLS